MMSAFTGRHLFFCASGIHQNFLSEVNEVRFEQVVPGYTLSMSVEWFFGEIFQNMFSNFIETLSSDVFLVNPDHPELYLG